MLLYLYYFFNVSLATGTRPRVLFIRLISTWTWSVHSTTSTTLNLTWLREATTSIQRGQRLQGRSTIILLPFLKFTIIAMCKNGILHDWLFVYSILRGKSIFLKSFTKLLLVFFPVVFYSKGVIASGWKPPSRSNSIASLTSIPTLVS